MDMLGFPIVNNVDFNKSAITFIYEIFYKNYNNLLSNCFAKYNFDEFIDILNKLSDIFENNRLMLVKSNCFILWFSLNLDKCNIDYLIKLPFFTKRIMMTELGTKIITEHKKFDLFPKIINTTNFEKLLTILLIEQPTNLQEIIDIFAEKLPIQEEYKCVSWDVAWKIPEAIFNHMNIFDKFNNNNKFELIKKYKKLNYLNRLTNIFQSKLKDIIDFMLEEDVTNLQKWMLLKAMYSWKDMNIFTKYPASIMNINYFVFISSIYPLHLVSYNHIGCVKKVIYDEKNIIIGIEIELTGKYYHDFMNVGTNILISNVYTEKVHKIKELYFSTNNENKVKVDMLVPIKHTKCYGEIIFEEYDFDMNKININTQVFYEKNF